MRGRFFLRPFGAPLLYKAKELSKRLLALRVTATGLLENQQQQDMWNKFIDFLVTYEYLDIEQFLRKSWFTRCNVSDKINISAAAAAPPEAPPEAAASAEKPSEVGVVEQEYMEWE